MLQAIRVDLRPLFYSFTLPLNLSEKRQWAQKGQTQSTIKRSETAEIAFEKPSRNIQRPCGARPSEPNDWFGASALGGSWRYGIPLLHSITWALISIPNSFFNHTSRKNIRKVFFFYVLLLICRLRFGGTDFRRFLVRCFSVHCVIFSFFL